MKNSKEQQIQNICRQDHAPRVYKPEFKIGASKHLCQPSPPFREIHGGKYAGGILWKGDDSYELFKSFKFAKDPDFKKHLNQYNAIHLNMQQFLGRTESVEDMIELISRKVVRELKREFPQVTYYEEDLVSVLEEIYSQTRSYFVFVIDEWDCIFRVNPMDAQAQKKYLNFLRDLLKNQPYCVLAYMTGILPIKNTANIPP